MATERVTRRGNVPPVRAIDRIRPRRGKCLVRDGWMGVPALVEEALGGRGEGRVRCAPLPGDADGGPAAVPAAEAGVPGPRRRTFYGAVTRRHYLGGSIGFCEGDTWPIPVSFGEAK